MGHPMWPSVKTQNTLASLITVYSSFTGKEREAGFVLLFFSNLPKVTQPASSRAQTEPTPQPILL